ncbi:hypothetical protein M6B38_120210 [Iris pallida]|uniref:Uncharacterized protein n=1 Tax=Iris pallida TaxID=29817 RepID=A0AAX6H8Z2_IRIPA|nr:hypothetical protein M6B38_120210 [Iris pallida]
MHEHGHWTRNLVMAVMVDDGEGNAVVVLTLVSQWMVLVKRQGCHCRGHGTAARWLYCIGTKSVLLWKNNGLYRTPKEYGNIMMVYK